MNVQKIRDEQPGSYFRELRDNFWVKILKFFDADPGSGIRDGKNSDPGSATNIPDPQHCYPNFIFCVKN
jgi:hypothetical protein